MRGKTTTRLLLAAVAAVLLVSGSCAAETTFEGVLDSTSGHDGTVYTVQLKNGTTVVLPGEPLSDYGNQTVPLLANVRVTCTLDDWRAEGLVANCTEVPPVTVLSTQSLADSEYKVAALTGETTTGVSYAFTMAVVDGLSSCGFRQPVTVDFVKSQLEKTGKLINACSYGQMSIKLDQIQVEPVTLSCSAARNAMLTCDYLTLRALALRELKTMGVVGSLHVGMVLPSGSSCKWSALAQVGGPFTWYTPTDYGLRVGTIVQELLHNFGLHHSSTDSGTCTCAKHDASCRCHSEYGDASTPMGRGDSCLNAPEMYRVNWATAIASLESASLQPGTPLTYQLPATYTTSTNMVIVKTNWLTPYENNLYFSLRVKGGADADLLSQFDGVVSVHATNQRVDAVSSNEQQDTHLLGTIKPKDEARLSAYKLVVKTGALADNALSITVCRYNLDASECSGAGNPGPTTSSPPPAGQGQCADIESTRDCEYWKELNYCDRSSDYAAYVNENCKRTCGGCSSCVDIDPPARCSSYAETFGCEGDQPVNLYLRKNCAKTCKQCGSNGGGVSAAATLAAAGQECVDLSSSCDVFKQLVGCKPTSENATLWMQLNCQATCDLCPVARSGASIATQPPLGCTHGYDVFGAKTINTTKGLDLTACRDLCFNTEGCYLATHTTAREDSDPSTCALHTTLPDAVASGNFKVVTAPSSTVCVVGTDQPSSAPKLLQWFYCTDGLDVAGSLVAKQPVSTELECAQACNATSACRLYTLLSDNSCVLKANPFSGDLGTNAVEDGITKSCIQTFYTAPDFSSDTAARRRRALQGAAHHAEPLHYGRRTRKVRRARKTLALQATV